jgi:hypothetical protein
VRRTALLLAGVVIGGGALLALSAELVRYDFVRDPVSANFVTLTLAIGIASLLVGAAIGIRVPASATGPLLVAAGVGAAIGYTRFSVHRWAAAIGFVVAAASALLPMHAAVAHGGGVSRRAHVGLVVTHVVLALLGVGIVLTAAGGTLDRWFIASDSSLAGAEPLAAPRWRYVKNPLLVVDAPGVARGCWVAWWVVLLLAGAAALTVRWRTWRAGPVRARRREAPVLAGAAGWMVAMLGAGGTMLFARVEGARLLLADLGAVVLPVLGLGLVAATTGWVDLVRPRLGRVSDGSVELARIQPADDAALRSLLGDVFATTRVDVVYARDAGWVDGRGRPYDLESERRTVTLIRQDGAPIAAVLHDADVPLEAIELGARVTGAQLQAQRAAALATSRADAVRAATGRLVRAGDRAAVRIEAELASGPIAELEALTAGLRGGERTPADAAASLRRVTADVREFSHGLYPRELETLGLTGVLQNRGIPNRRLDAATEMTCYLLARDDPAAVFVDRDDCIEVDRSLPLTVEMVERVEALGGRAAGTFARVAVE